MLWLFAKAGARLRVLTSLDESGKYVVEVDRPDHIPEVYRFADEETCSHFLTTLEEKLEAEDWAPDGVRLVDRKNPLE